MKLTCREVGEREELLLDGELVGPEAAACLDHLELCADCRSRFEGGPALERLILASLPRLRAGDDRNSAARPAFRRAIPWAAAAAVLLSIGFLAFDQGRRVEREDGAHARPDLALATEQAHWVAPSDRSLALRGPSGGMVTLSANSRLGVQPDGTLELLAGALSYDATASELQFHVPCASARLLARGQGSLLSAGVGGRPFSILTPTSGSATVRRGSAEVDSLPLGDAHVLSAAWESGVGSALARLDELSSNEALVVVTREEAFEATERDQQTKEQLEAELGELLAENSRIRLENETLRRKHAVADNLTLRDLFQSVGELSEVAHGPRRMELGTLVRAAARASTGREAEAVEAVHATLWASGSSSERRRAGFMLLGALRSAVAKQALVDALSTVDKETRPQAIEALASHDDPSLRDLFVAHFRESSDESVRLAAAGALVRLGDVGEPLAWLESFFDRPVLSGRARMRILSRLLAGPSDRVGPILVKALTSPRLSVHSKTEIVSLLGRMGTRKAIEVLEFVAQVPIEPELLREIERALARLRQL